MTQEVEEVARTVPEDVCEVWEGEGLNHSENAWGQILLCNPELQKLKGSWYLWAGSLENKCPGGWLWDRKAWPGALTFGLGVISPGPRYSKC